MTFDLNFKFSGTDLSDIYVYSCICIMKYTVHIVLFNRVKLERDNVIYISGWVPPLSYCTAVLPIVCGTLTINKPAASLFICNLFAGL